MKRADDMMYPMAWRSFRPSSMGLSRKKASRVPPAKISLAIWRAASGDVPPENWSS